MQPSKDLHYQTIIVYIVDYVNGSMIKKCAWNSRAQNKTYFPLRAFSNTSASSLIFFAIHLFMNCFEKHINKYLSRQKHILFFCLCFASQNHKGIKYTLSNNWIALIFSTPPCIIGYLSIHLVNTLTQILSTFWPK